MIPRWQMIAMLFAISMNGGLLAEQVVLDRPTRIVAPELRFEALSLLADARGVAAFVSGEGVRLLTLPDWSLAASLPIEKAGMGPLATSINGMVVAGGPGQNTLLLWNPTKKRIVGRIKSPAAPFDVVSFSSDGEHIVVGDHEGLATIWNIKSGKLIRKLAGHIATITGIAYSPDGARIATTAADNDLCIWDGRDGQLVRRIDTPTHSPFAVLWLDGERLIIGGASCTISVWDSKTGNRIKESARQPQAVLTLARSPDGRVVAAGGMNLDAFTGPADIRIYDSSSLSEIRKIQGHKGAVTGLAFTPDASFLLSASSVEPGIKVWTVKRSGTVD